MGVCTSGYHKRRIIVPGKGFYPTETVSVAILEMHLNGNSKSLPVKSDRLRYGEAARKIRAVTSHTHTHTQTHTHKHTHTNTHTHTHIQSVRSFY